MCFLEFDTEHASRPSIHRGLSAGEAPNLLRCPIALLIARITRIDAAGNTEVLMVEEHRPLAEGRGQRAPKWSVSRLENRRADSR